MLKLAIGSFNLRVIHSWQFQFKGYIHTIKYKAAHTFSSLLHTTTSYCKMKFKLVFLLVVAAVAVTAQTTEEGSEAVSTSRSYGDSVLVTLLKVKIGCLNRQMAVCENLLTTATRNCQLCECHHARFM